jgi:multimeric flavodoxin WrbA
MLSLKFVMRVLGIYGSPRKGGNSDALLDKALAGARSEGAEIKTIYARELKIAGCRECGGCDKTGECLVEDAMQEVYPRLVEADIIILATPIFYYAVPAQLKALIDRTQAMWSKRLLTKPREQWKNHESGKGYLIAVGATKGKNLFEGVELTARYFFDAMDMSYEGGLFYRRVEGKDAIKERPEALSEAFEFGKKIIKENDE